MDVLDLGRLLSFLQAHTALGLATDGGEAPWASILFYANDGSTLYFMTEPDKRLVVNIASNPRVAATVVDEGDGLSTACGVQMVGRVAEVTTPAEAARGRALLLATISAPTTLALAWSETLGLALASAGPGRQVVRFPKEAAHAAG